MFDLLLGGSQFTTAADQTGRSRGRPITVEPSFSSSSPVAVTKRRPAPLSLRNPSAVSRRIDKPGAAEQVPRERLEPRVTLDQSIAPSNHPFEPIQANAITRSSRGQFVDTNQANAAIDFERTVQDRGLHVATADDHVLASFTEGSINQRRHFDVHFKTLGNNAVQIVGKRR